VKGPKQRMVLKYMDMNCRLWLAFSQFWLEKTLAVLSKGELDVVSRQIKSGYEVK